MTDLHVSSSSLYNSLTSQVGRAQSRSNNSEAPDKVLQKQQETPSQNLQRVQSADPKSSVVTYSQQASNPDVKTKVMQNNELVRQEQLQNYKAMTYANHGYKGNYVDTLT
jgi:hypothetical protein